MAEPLDHAAGEALALSRTGGSRSLGDLLVERLAFGHNNNISGGPGIVQGVSSVTRAITEVVRYALARSVQSTAPGEELHELNMPDVNATLWALRELSELAEALDGRIVKAEMARLQQRARAEIERRRKAAANDTGEVA